MHLGKARLTSANAVLRTSKIIIIIITMSHVNHAAKMKKKIHKQHCDISLKNWLKKQKICTLSRVPGSRIVRAFSSTLIVPCQSPSATPLRVVKLCHNMKPICPLIHQLIKIHRLISYYSFPIIKQIWPPDTKIQ